MVRLKPLIYPGETILLREERSLGEIAVRVFAPFAGAGGLFYAVYYGIGHIGGWLDSMGGMISLFAGLFAIFLLAVYWPVILALPFDWLLSRRRSDHWRIAVTDQRVLVRRGLMGGGHEEMMRYDIENCLHDRAGGKILLTGADHELAIACGQPQMGRILKALGRDEIAS